MNTNRGSTAWQLGRPHLVRHFLLAGLAGVLAGNACVVALLGLDVGGLRTVMEASDALWTAGPLLCFGFASTFGSAAIGASVMTIGQD